MSELRKLDDEYLNESRSESGPADSGPFLILSGHDYRSKRRASIHFISGELARNGKTRFFSIGFSSLSLVKGDPRSSLWSSANRVEKYEGLECFLWKTPWHPFNLRASSLSAVERQLFHIYAGGAPDILKKWVAEASTILFESGMSIILFDMVKNINPTAKLIYIASDSLETIGCSPILLDKLPRIAPLFNTISLPSGALAADFPPGCALTLVPHGMDQVSSNAPAPDLYASGINLISVGSMLFDAKFFEIAASAFPNLTFHIIGGGKQAEALRGPNVFVLGETPFDETRAYIAHADAGIAAYRGDKVAPYLADTSLKLMQFGAYGLPSVCPYIAVGDHEGRFGYQPGNRPSIVSAIRAALAHGRFAGKVPPTWAEVTRQILNPSAYVAPSIAAGAEQDYGSNDLQIPA